MVQLSPLQAVTDVSDRHLVARLEPPRSARDPLIAEGNHRHRTLFIEFHAGLIL